MIGRAFGFCSKRTAVNRSRAQDLLLHFASTARGAAGQADRRRGSAREVSVHRRSSLGTAPLQRRHGAILWLPAEIGEIGGIGVHERAHTLFNLNDPSLTRGRGFRVEILRNQPLTKH